MSATIKRDEIKKHLDAGDSMILVEALPEQYFKKEHLPGAINIPHDAVDRLSEQLLPDKDAFIVVYCASTTCPNSKIEADRLAQLGYRNVREYVEGKADWIEAGLNVQSN